MFHCIILLCLISSLYIQVDAYVRHSPVRTIGGKITQESSNVKLFLFGNKASNKVAIQVDGKTITSDEKAVNLRKELMKNNVDVYPLRAKITGNLLCYCKCYLIP